MKTNLRKYLSLALAVSVGLGIASCKKEAFVEANLDPATLYEVSPENQFLAASQQVANDYEYYYDVYRSLNLWLQYSTPSAGNGLNFNLPSGNFNHRYNNFYNNVGTKLMDAIQIIDAMPEETRASYGDIRNIAEILFNYYAFYTSDINGSIPYSEAFQARYGGTLTPAYDPQQSLFTAIDAVVAQAVNNLKAPTSVEQVNLGLNDPFFAGKKEYWIKAGNALRLRIASRFMKRDEAKLRAIASEVLSDANQMSSIDDSWEFKAGPTYARAADNWNPASYIAAKPLLDFMVNNNDPRLPIYFRPNAGGTYVGGFPSPDESRKPEHSSLYETINNFSQLQHRLFTPNYDEGNGAGTGSAFFPLITYPEYCFLRADFAARGYTSDNAEEWYRKGVYASLEYYDKHAGPSSTTEIGLNVGTDVEGHVAVSEAQKDTYYNSEKVRFNASTAVEQIAVQAYFDFYRNPFEAWSWWKRTGYPSTNSSVFAWARLTANGSDLALPRRAPLSYLPTSNLNYENQRTALEQMMQDPSFGSAPGDAFGRVWWDAQ